MADFKFRRQHPIGNYIADFVCLDERLIIEIDGGQHADRVNYDNGRTRYLNTLGFRVIRFWDNEVLKDIEAVKEQIWRTLSRE